MPKSYAVGLQPLPTADKEAFFGVCRRACANMDDAGLDAWVSNLDTLHKVWFLQWYHADIETGVPEDLLEMEALYFKLAALNAK